MSGLIETIKDLAHEVSEEYTLMNKSMNDSLLALVNDGSIENDEILKRICEQANQNVYLALLNDPDVDNSNILFDVADFNNILENSKEGETAMKDYNTPPDDFRSEFEIAVSGPMEKKASALNTMKELGAVVEYRQSFRNLRNSIEIIKNAELKSAEESFDKMLCDTRDMVAHGESIGDIAKIATRFVKDEIEGDFMKVAECYDTFHQEMIKSGFNVKTGFTKISSQRINNKSDMLVPVREFSMSLAKIAGAQSMIDGIDKSILKMDALIKT